MTGGSDSTAHWHPAAAPSPWRPCTFGAQELRVGSHVVALVGGNQFAALHLASAEQDKGQQGQHHHKGGGKYFENDYISYLP